MNQSAYSVSLAGNEFKRTTHACAFFNSSDEEYSVMLPFARDGLKNGEKLFQVVDPKKRAERLRRLADIGKSVAVADNQIEVRVWEDAHLRGGKFELEAMLALVHEALEEGHRGGFSHMRFWGNMEWAFSDKPGVEDMVEYEAKLNFLLQQYDDIVVCTYDLSRFRATTVMDVLRTHPMVIIGGVLQENPFFISPAEFLKELQERKQHEHCAASAQYA